MNTPFAHEEIDIAALARIEEVLRLREAVDPSPRRAETIRSVRAIRDMLPGNGPEGSTMPGDASIREKLAAVLQELASLELTSLGTAEAQRVRSTAAPSGVADILGRHEQPRISRITSPQADDASAAPTVLRILLGTHLRRLREQRNIPRKDAASAIRASESKMSRIELGRIPTRDRDLMDLLILYGVEPDERDQLFSLAVQANRPDWWQRYNDILPDWYHAYLGLESSAMLIRIHEPRFVPDLLQTPEYAAAVLALADLPPDEAERHVLVRKERQRRFEDGQVRLWAVIDEAALRRPIGGKAILLDQLRHLLDATRAPNFSLQITPRDMAYVSPGPFNILRFRDEELPDIAYVENLASALYLDKESDVNRYLRAFVQLGVISASPNEARRILMTIISQLDHGLDMAPEM